MTCRAIEIWTLSSLIGAYLDLTLAYLFLIGATIAFFASKLLSLFGFSLPCSCDGHFGHPACAQTNRLIDFPASNVTAVHRSLRSRFPYDSHFPAGTSSSTRCRYAVRLPSEDGDTCSAASLSRQSRSVSLPAPSTSLRHSPRPRLGDSMSNLEKFPSALAERVSGGLWNSGEDESGTCFAEEAAIREKDSCSFVGGVSRCHEGDRLDIMRSLEKELEVERGARAALYLELEKERSAASTAADEAMSMILRLQKERAEIEMEARQYQRMIEEKSAYDEEEMEILKEIIVRREMEKHVLEKAFEMYKQTLDSRERREQDFDREQNFLEEKRGILNDSSDNPMTMLRQIYKFIGKKELADGFGVESPPTLNSNGDCSYLGTSIQKFVDVGKHVELFNNGDECDQEFPEKSMLTTQIKPCSSNNLNFSPADDSSLYNLNAPYEAEYNKDIADLTVRNEGDGRSLIEIRVPVDDLCRMGSDDTNQRGSESSQPETESSIHDIHVINDGQSFQFEENSNQNTILREEEYSCADFNEMGLNNKKTCSEISTRIGLMDGLSGRSSYIDLRRSSLPSVESERYKLETEVELLRKRLEIIRQGREKLNQSTDHKEKESFQLQLLDEIACQLKEIKKVSEQTKSFRRASLPPLSLKMASGGDFDPPRRSITNVFRSKKSISRGRGGTEGPPASTTPTTAPTTAPPAYYTTPHAPTYHSPAFPSPDPSQTTPFYPYPSYQQPPPPAPHHTSYCYPPYPPTAGIGQPSTAFPNPQPSHIPSSSTAGPSTQERRGYIEPEGDTFNPPQQAVHKIRDIIRGKFDAPYVSWKEIPVEVRDMWFREFEQSFYWLPTHNERIRRNFERRASNILRDMFTDIRKKGERPIWIGERVWLDLTRAWASEEYRKMREQNKKNRAADPAQSSCLHTGGSVPSTEHRRRLKNVLGREPSIAELHARTHQRQDNQQWVDERAKRVSEEYVRLRELQSQSSGAGSSTGSSQYGSEFGTWSQAAGGKKKGRVYGLGSQGSAYIAQTSHASQSDVSGQSMHYWIEELRSTKERLAMVEAYIQSQRAEHPQPQPGGHQQPQTGGDDGGDEGDSDDGESGNSED